MVYVEEGNCPSDGCSLEAAAPAAGVDGGVERLKRWGETPANTFKSFTFHRSRLFTPKLSLNSSVLPLSTNEQHVFPSFKP